MRIYIYNTAAKMYKYVVYLSMFSFKIIQGAADQTEEDLPNYRNSSNYSTGVEDRYRQYPQTKEPDTISQTSFRSINEKDYGRFADTQENERVLVQVNTLLVYAE